MKGRFVWAIWWRSIPSVLGWRAELSALGDANMPLAAWRVYRAGVEVCESLGEPAEAARYRARFEDVIRTLAGNFEPDDRLRSSLLAALDAPRGH